MDGLLPLKSGIVRDESKRMSSFSLVLEAIMELLSNPELQYYIIEKEVGEMCKNKKLEYQKCAQEWTHQFAMK